MKIRYQIYDQQRWCNVKKGAPEVRYGKEWLRYELSDGTIGLARPDTWRVKA